MAGVTIKTVNYNLYCSIILRTDRARQYAATSQMQTIGHGSIQKVIIYYRVKRLSNDDGDDREQ